MKRTLEKTSIFDVDFNDVYCDSVVERSYRHLLHSDEQSPSTGIAAGKRYNGVGETATTTGTELASLGGATAGTCSMTTVTYPLTASISIADQHTPLIPTGSTTISYGCASSATHSIIACNNVEDIGSRLISNNQVQYMNRTNVDSISVEMLGLKSAFQNCHKT